MDAVRGGEKEVLGEAAPPTLIGLMTLLSFKDCVLEGEFFGERRGLVFFIDLLRRLPSPTDFDAFFMGTRGVEAGGLFFVSVCLCECVFVFVCVCVCVHLCAFVCVSVCVSASWRASLDT